MANVTLYSKPDCPLCEEARLVLERARANTAFDLEEIDITSRDTLFEEYGERIPVVAINGREAFQYFVDEQELDRLLAAAPEAVG